jgi:hypothetical protein
MWHRFSHSSAVALYLSFIPSPFLEVVPFSNTSAFFQLSADSAQFGSINCCKKKSKKIKPFSN